MKTIFSLFTMLLLFTSCNTEGDFTFEEKLRHSGTFLPTSGITVNGEVKIYRLHDTHLLKLDNFSISHGPDLKVYLSKTDSPVDFINLGDLDPEMTYAIPSEVNLADYPYVLIHCRQYNHLYAISALEPN